MEFIAKAPFNSLLPWHFYFIISQLVVFASLRLSSGLPISQWFAALSKNSQDVDASGVSYFNTILTLLGWLNVAFTLNITGQYFSWDAFTYTGSYSFLVSVIGIAFWMTLYMLVFNFGIWISEEEKVFNQLQTSFFKVFRVYGLVGLIVNLLLIFIPLEFVKIVHYLAIILIVTLLTIRLFQGIGVALKKGVSIWYIILYLCALEIAPLLCLAKAIM